MRGPAPKRSDQKLGHQTKAEKAEIDQVTVEVDPDADPNVDSVTGEVVAPDAPERWDPIARDWYLSLAQSGQARFYEPSDWQVAYVWAELLSRELKSGKKPSAMMMAQWNSVQADLLTTEGARRRARLELTRVLAAGGAGIGAGNVSLLDDYRDALG